MVVPVLVLQDRPQTLLCSTEMEQKQRKKTADRAGGASDTHPPTRTRTHTHTHTHASTL